MKTDYCGFTPLFISLIFRQICAQTGDQAQSIIDFLMALDGQRPIKRLVAFYEENRVAASQEPRVVDFHLNLHRACSARGIFLSAAKISNSSSISFVNPNQPPIVAAFFFTSAAPTASFLRTATERTDRVFWICFLRAGRSIPNWQFLRADTHLMLLIWENNSEAKILQWSGAGFVRSAASWKSGDKIIALNALARPKMSLAARVISVAVFHDPPFVILPTGDSELSQQSVRGWLVELWLELQARMNFTSKFYRTSRQSGGIFKRAVAELQSGRADVVLAPFAIVFGDADVVDYTMPVTTLSFGFVVPRISATSSLNQFLQPFSLSLWRAIAAILTLAVILMTTAFMLGQIFGFEAANRPLYGLYESALIIYGSLLTQGPDFSPRSLSARMILWCSYTFGVLIGLIYSASLTSKLTLGILQPPFSGLDEFLASSYTPILVTDSPPHRLITNALSGSWKDMRERKPHPRVVQTLESALTEVADPWSSATMLDAKERVLPKILELGMECNLMMVSEESVVKLQAHLMMSKMSPLKKSIDQTLARMLTSGQLSRLRQRWLRVPPAQEFCPRTTSLLQFGMENVAMPFYTLAGGFCIGVLILFFEFVARRWLWDQFQPLELLRQIMHHYSTRANNLI